MSWETIKAEWKDVQGRARVQWGKLTDDDLARIHGEREQLAAAVQKRYGLLKKEAQDQVDAWAQSIKKFIDPPTKTA